MVDVTAHRPHHRDCQIKVLRIFRSAKCDFMKGFVKKLTSQRSQFLEMCFELDNVNVDVDSNYICKAVRWEVRCTVIDHTDPLPIDKSEFSRCRFQNSLGHC